MKPTPVIRTMLSLSVAIAAVLIALPAVAQTPHRAAFVGPADGAINDINAYITWLNVPDLWASDNMAQDTWQNIENPTWQFPAWGPWVAARSGRTLSLGVPMFPQGQGNLTDGAAGLYDQHFKNMADSLVANGLGNSILRIGWEFNGD